MEPPRGAPPWAPVAAQPASTSEGGEGEGEAGTRAQEAGGVTDEWGEAKAAAIGAAQHLKRLRLSSSASSASSARPPPPPPPPQREGVGWVSTELHLGMARSITLARDVLSSSGAASDGDAAAVARWLGLESDLLARPFATLSQGEQKRVLIGAALAKRPALLVLDEPMQGLDADSRSLVLRLVERVCSHTSTSLVYITHHYEEVLPCVTHVMHLKGGVATFCGDRATYEQSWRASTT
jgi:hypothetical protein